jgi:hypothetical protein
MRQLLSVSRVVRNSMEMRAKSLCSVIDGYVLFAGSKELDYFHRVVRRFIETGKASLLIHKTCFIGTWYRLL